ncbi:riboflavin synthase [Paenibacillaceae bacterium]|nr:riboflavin synthase [Paenibacillaceae bacterium]
MFTGLIEEIGKLRYSGKQGESMVLVIEASKVLEGVRLGDSISVNGVCLTVTAYDRTSFTVDVTPQTYRHSNLKDVRSGGALNLERAMLAGGRFGGHIVQGHSDATGTIIARSDEGNSVWYTIRPDDAAVVRHIIPQGSITLDGISLTIAESDGQTFSVAIIPLTLKETALQFKKPGDTVNIETDILGKYVEHLLKQRPASGADSGGGSRRRGGLTTNYLTEHGFL